MTTQTFTVHNTGATLALKFTTAGGASPPIYVAPGMWNDITISEGSPQMVELVANSVVPQGGGGRPEE
jgi:hypothetical protein